MLRIINHIFLRILTIIVIAIGYFYLSNNRILKETVYHNEYLSFFCTMLQTSQRCSDPQEETQQLASLLKNRNLQEQYTIFSQWFTIDMPSHLILEKASLYHLLQGNITNYTGNSIELILEYLPKQGPSIQRPITLHQDTLRRSIEISKGNDLMEAGVNNYNIIIKHHDNILGSLPITINSHASEIALSNTTTLYLDEQFHNNATPIVQEHPSYQGLISYQVFHGCEESTSEKAIIKQGLQFHTIPLCFQYSKDFGSLFLFTGFAQEHTQETITLYSDVYSGDTLVYAKFPMIRGYNDQRFSNTIHQEGDGSILGIYEVFPGRFGNNFRYTRIDSNKRVIFEILTESIGNIRMRNQHESVLLWLYKDLADVSTMFHPGLSSVYRPYTQYNIQYHKNLVYPLGGYEIKKPDYKQPTRTLTATMQSGEVIISDRIKTIRYAIDNLKQPHSVESYRRNSYGYKNCNTIDVSILNSKGQQVQNGPMQTYFLSLEDYGNYTAKVYHDNKLLSLHSYGDYSSVLLQKEVGNIRGGTNLYDIRLYDNDIELCSKKISLFIQ